MRGWGEALSSGLVFSECKLAQHSWAVCRGGGGCFDWEGWVIRRALPYLQLPGLWGQASVTSKMWPARQGFAFGTGRASTRYRGCGAAGWHLRVHPRRRGQPWTPFQVLRAVTSEHLCAGAQHVRREMCRKCSQAVALGAMVRQWMHDHYRSLDRSASLCSLAEAATSIRSAQRPHGISNQACRV